MVTMMTVMNDDDDDWPSDSNPPMLRLSPNMNAHAKTHIRDHCSSDICVTEVCATLQFDGGKMYEQRLHWLSDGEHVKLRPGAGLVGCHGCSHASAPWPP